MQISEKYPNEIDAMVVACQSIDPDDYSNQILFLFQVELEDNHIHDLEELVMDANDLGRAEAAADYLGIAVH